MDERSQERIEKSKTCKHDADCVNGYRSGEVLCNLYGWAFGGPHNRGVPPT